MDSRSGRHKLDVCQLSAMSESTVTEKYNFDPKLQMRA